MTRRQPDPNKNSRFANTGELSVCIILVLKKLYLLQHQSKTMVYQNGTNVRKKILLNKFFSIISGYNPKFQIHMDTYWPVDLDLTAFLNSVGSNYYVQKFEVSDIFRFGFWKKR